MNPHNRDHFLETLVEIVNATGMSFGVTLMTGGSTISGNLISGKTWFDLQVKAIKAVPEAEETQLHTFFERQRDNLTQQDDELAVLRNAVGEADLADRYLRAISEADPIGYVHIEHAHVHSGTESFPTGEGLLWRGRIDTVTGWAIGRLTQPSD